MIFYFKFNGYADLLIFCDVGR